MIALNNSNTKGVITMTLSLKSEILERLNLKKGGKKTASANISRATKDFATSDAPQFRGKSPAKRHQMAVAAGLEAARETALPKKGDKVLYEGRQVVVESCDPNSGMAVVRRGKTAQVIVRSSALKAPKTLTEAVLGLSPIPPTWVEPRISMMPRFEALSPEDIGLEIINIREDDFTGEEDDQEEETDNGSNIRHDGHTNKKEVDELPTPSDTIATAYSDEKPPKEMGSPLSTEPGFSVATDPDFDGYDYPADAPEIPTADFQGDDAGNPRAPNYSGGGHDGGDNLDKREDDDDDRTDESAITGLENLKGRHPSQKGIRQPSAAGIGKKKYGKKMREAFGFITEMGDMLDQGDDEREPEQGDEIKVTLPALASILCTVAHRMGADVQSGGEDEMLLRSMIEALDEVGHGKTIDVPDLEAVAAHINGEESQEIGNRDAGQPDHEGIAMGDNGDQHHGHNEPADAWPGDGEKTRHGKTKLMGGVAEGEVTEGGDYYGLSDIMAENVMTDAEEMRMIKRRAGLKFW